MRQLRLILMLSLIFALTLARAEIPRNVPLWDGGELPVGWPEENPFNILAAMNSWTNPVLDHTGKPHAHGHIVQLIMDGGNHVQDPPQADGMPGGDDSLAYGNFNSLKVLGVDGYDDPKGKSGMFYSQRYFVPLVPNRSYYMRIWEGDDVKTAPYFQNTAEYKTETDQGGAMITLRGGLPCSVDWSFGASQPRPAGAVVKPSGAKQ